MANKRRASAFSWRRGAETRGNRPDRAWTGSRRQAARAQRVFAVNGRTEARCSGGAPEPACATWTGTYFSLQWRTGGDGSHGARPDRRYRLAQMATLPTSSACGLRAKRSKGRHIEARVCHWFDRRQETTMSRMARIRSWAKQVGEADISEVERRLLP